MRPSTFSHCLIVIDSLLLAAARIGTFEHRRGLTNASGFFFQREGQLFLVTSRHVLIDEPSHHHPNRIEIELHTSVSDLGQSTGFSLLLYQDGKSIWRQGRDASGEIDVAVIEIDRTALPADTVMFAFTPAHLVDVSDTAPAKPSTVTTATSVGSTTSAQNGGNGGVDVGSSLLIVGFPLGFHDTLHHLPVVRQAVLATAFGLRFQGEGYFLTDARTHRGTSGSPVVMRDSTASADPALPWKLLGVHSGRLDMSTRDRVQDESLGLNIAWYADILMTLTAPPPAPWPAAGRAPGVAGDPQLPPLAPTSATSPSIRDPRVQTNVGSGREA